MEKMRARRFFVVAAAILTIAAAGIVPAGTAAHAQTASPPASAGDAAPGTPVPSAGDANAASAPQPSEASGTPFAQQHDPTLPRDLTPWGMFMAADYVVKAVMLGLAFASFLTWTIWLAKGIELLGARRSAKSGTQILSRARSLRESAEKLTRSGGAVAGFVRAAVLEVNLSADAIDKHGVKERVASRLERIEQAAGRRMARGTGILATIGATAPFVGLFGTVWGIMNSFIGISKAQTTNLAIVAPGIAEALLATAIGLVAAIPAVVIFNVFARAIIGYRMQLGDAAAEVLRLTSRDLDRSYPAEGRTRAPLAAE